MGLILDSAPIIAGERRGLTVQAFLRELKQRYGENETIGFSTVTVVELSHGVARANTEERRRTRLLFVDELLRDIPSYPLTAAIARLAGRIEGEAAVRGVVIPFEDLLIGATALHLDFGVVTGNARHFSLIPGLKVVSF